MNFNKLKLLLASAFIFLFFVKVFQLTTRSSVSSHLERTSVKKANHDHKNQFIKSCLNEVKFNHELSVWTMLTDDSNYTHSAVKLLKSIEQNVKSTKFDKLILELDEKRLPTYLKEILTKAGWTICIVYRIAPRDEQNTFPRFRDQFTKLILFNMSEYTSVVYFDSDTLVVNNIEPLLNIHKQLDKENKKIACTKDIRDGQWQDTFNMGVFSIRPNQTEFERLIKMKSENKVHFETAMSEQGFLNVVYKNKWLEFGFENNANLAVYSQKKEYWTQSEQNINVIHYTMNKPWACSTEYIQVCNKWIEFKA